MNKTLKIFVIVALSLAVNVVFATSKKKVVKKVHHVTTLEDVTKPVTITLPQGKLEAIKIPVKMATGYSWELVKVGDNLKQPYKPRVIQPKANSDEVSVKEYQIFYIRGIKKGESTVEFEYRQPFDKEAKPEKEMVVKIEVE